MESQTIPDVNLPFGQVRTFNNFKEHLAIELKSHLTENKILKEKCHDFRINFKRDLITFLNKQIRAYFPGPGEWSLQVATELAYMCVVYRSACEGCGEEIACKILCEEKINELIYNIVMLKLFDYEVGIMPRLYGLKPLITQE